MVVWTEERKRFIKFLFGAGIVGVSIGYQTFIPMAIVIIGILVGAFFIIDALS